ncbi:NIPSNAP family protein [Sphingopyxis flava]|uniref:NIPSNAP protein n=1 Tax=Sphingopyxis flava TaxID=1507287 RepID=A0A1T5FGT3_9SPHN|nr:NIPSNAP family protein [Sphingopyxis flava]SKB95371.1 NIPSNAP protein [Sphingopyxis flava]
MILERRAYEVDAGQEREFWAVQRDWYWPPEIGDFFNHLVGYFETTELGAKQIVHLYRYASLADWEGRYQALYKRFPPHLFGVVRSLLSAQENSFMAPAPIDLPNIADLDRSAGPPAGYPLYGKAPPEGLIVQETVTDFLPGGLFIHWDAIRELPGASAILGHNLIGMFHSTTGRLHRKYEYRWFESRDAAIAHEIEMAQDTAAAGVAEKSLPHQAGRSVRYLKPAPFRWLRPLFEPMDWEHFEARDQSARRIQTW